LIGPAANASHAATGKQLDNLTVWACAAMEKNRHDDAPAGAVSDARRALTRLRHGPIEAVISRLRPAMLRVTTEWGV
jgi:hypothetical protein